MEGSVQIDVPESHSNIEQENKPRLSWDVIIVKSLSNFGWIDFLQAVLVAIAMFFDAQQSFISIYTDNYPKCTAQTQTQIHHVLHPMIFANSQDPLGLGTHTLQTQSFLIGILNVLVHSS